MGNTKQNINFVAHNLKVVGSNPAPATKPIIRFHKLGKLPYHENYLLKSPCQRV